MRTLFEIIEDAKDGKKPAYLECYYAMLALSTLHSMDGVDMHRIWEKGTAGKYASPEAGIATESLNRTRRALDVSPQDYLGWTHDPTNPEYQKFRKDLKRLYKQVVGDPTGDKT